MSHSQVVAMLAQAGVRGEEADELRAVLGPLTQLGREVPEPSAELQALFGEDSGAAGGDAARRTGRSRGRGTVAGAVVLALSGVGATGLSAAANSLPSPWQRGVSEFSRHYLPFDFPEPTAQPRRPDGAPGARPAVRSDRDGGLVRGLLRERAEDAADDTTRGLDRPRRAAKAAPSWIGRDRAEGDERPDRDTGYSWPASHAPQPRPDQASPSDDLRGAAADDRREASDDDGDRRRDGGDDRDRDRSDEDRADRGGDGADASTGEQQQSPQPQTGRDREDPEPDEAGRQDESPERVESSDAPRDLTLDPGLLGPTVEALPEGDEHRS